MAISIHANVNSLFTQRAVNVVQNTVRTSVDRLSSGMRINNAKDDAAGLAISSRMTSDIRSSAPLMRGINDGISLLQVAGGGIRSILDVMQRMREMTVHAANGTLTASDREALNAEYQELLNQVDFVANKTESFGIFPLKGNPVVGVEKPAEDYVELVNGNVPHITDRFPNSGDSINFVSSGIKPIGYIPAGAINVNIEIDGYPGAEDDMQIFAVDGKHLVGTPVSDFTWTANSASNVSDMKNKVLKTGDGFNAGAFYDAAYLLDGSQKFAGDINANPSGALSSNFSGMKFTYSGDGDYYDGSVNDGSISGVDTKEYLHIDKTTEPLIFIITGTGVFGATVSWDKMPAKAEGPVPASEKVPPVLTPAPGLQILTSATPGMAPTFVNIEKTPSDTASLGLVGSALNPLDEVVKAMNALDAAINKVSSYAATHGAIEARLASAVENAQISAENTSAARGRIADADFAIESAQLAAQMVRSSAGTAMTAQANLSAKLVLDLLR